MSLGKSWVVKMANIRDQFRERERKAFFGWVVSRLVAGECVAVDLPLETALYVKDSRKNDLREYRRARGLAAPVPSFVIAPPMSLAAAFGKFSRSDVVFAPTEDWHPLFRSSVIEIWENKGRFKGVPCEQLPLRLGLNQTEGEAAMRHIRRVLADDFALSSQEESQELGQRFSERADVGVALWVKGQLRGSQIVTGLSLREALTEAARRAAYDDRFKPLEPEELAETRLEITLLSDVRMPLSVQERMQQERAWNRGYRMTVGKRSGWYVPEVFNCIRFCTLDVLLEHLIEDKVGLDKRFLSQADVETFEVQDYVEAYGHERSLTLIGPVAVAADREYEDYDECFQSDVRQCLDRAALHLCRIQGMDGHLPPIINPLNGKENQIDWSRLALTATALAEYGACVGVDRYVHAAKRIVAYLLRHLEKHRLLTLNTRLATDTYLAEVFWGLGMTEEAQAAAQRILSLADQARYRPILFLKMSAALALVDSENETNVAKSKELFDTVYADFENLIREKVSIELAFIPEAINAGFLLDEKTNDRRYREKALAVENWLKMQQFADGAFPSVIGSRFSYTRGTGKIFEALALRPEENRQSLLRAFRWLRMMQYTDENMYFVPEAFRERIRGGFRHDWMNQEVWIDASAHVLLGWTRVLRFLKTDPVFHTEKKISDFE